MLLLLKVFREAFSMENEKSKIPTYNFQRPIVVGVLKDANSENNFDSNPPAVFRGTNQRSVKPKKEVAPPPSKKAAAPVPHTTSKYRRDADLRSKNKALETTKCELSLKVTGLQSTIKDLQEKNDELIKENQKLMKFQKGCMLILETKNCDAVTDNILEEEEENNKRRTQIMALTENLNADLEQFSQLVKEQKDNLQNAQTKWNHVEEERTQFLEQQQTFLSEMEDLSALLDEEEKEALLN